MYLCIFSMQDFYLIVEYFHSLVLLLLSKSLHFLFVCLLYQLKAKIIVKYVFHVEITGVVFVILWSSKPKIKIK